MANLKENSMGGGMVAIGTRPLGEKKRRVKKTAKKLTPEGILRESIRTIIRHAKYKFYEEKGRQFLQEQKLRGVIRQLLEATDRTPLGTTGGNYAFKALDRILTGFKSAYMDMTSSKEQRDNYYRVFSDGVKKYLENLDRQRGKKFTMQDEEPEPTGGPVVNEPVAAPAEPEEPSSPLEEEENKLKDISTSTISGLEASAEIDVTGQKEAFDALRTALPQIGEEYEKLSLDEDRAEFVNLIFGKNGEPGSLELTVRDIENELNEKVPETREGSGTEEPSTDMVPDLETAPEEGGDEELEADIASLE